MSKFFSSDNRFFGMMSKVFDMLILGTIWLIPFVPMMLIGNVLDALKAPGPSWLAMFLPLILLGPLSTALYYSIVKVIRKERGYVSKEFMRSFKLNIKQSLIVMAIYLVIGLLMVFDFQYAEQLSAEGSKFGSIMYGVFLVQAIFVLFTLIYIFPILSRFTVSTKQLFKWSFFFSVRHIISTLILIVLFGATAVVMFFSLPYCPPLLLIMPGLYTLVSSLVIERVFKKYMPKEEESDEESGVDHWYND